MAHTGSARQKDEAREKTAQTNVAEVTREFTELVKTQKMDKLVDGLTDMLQEINKAD